MDKFVARANIDHYLDMLHNGHAFADSRSTIVKLLIEEENSFAI